MINKLPTLCDQLIRLINLRAARERTFFQEFVQPIHDDLKAVVKDYREMFEHTKQQLADPTVPLDKIIADLYADRETLAITREELSAASRAVAGATHATDELKQFCRMSLLVITSGPAMDVEDVQAAVPGPAAVASGATSLIRSLEKMASESSQPAGRAAAVSAALDRVDRAWREALEAYHQLRVKCLKYVGG